jgi:hypothetical protein
MGIIAVSSVVVLGGLVGLVTAEVVVGKVDSERRYNTLYAMINKERQVWVFACSGNVDI